MSIKQIGLLLGLWASLSACTPVIHAPTPTPIPSLPVEREPTLLATQEIPDSLSVLAITPGETSQEDAISKIEILSRVLDIPLNRDELRVSEDTKPDVYRFHDGEHKFTVYRASGAIEYRHTNLYQLGPEDVGEGAPSDEAILGLAGRDLERLTEGGLIDPDQLDDKHVHITHQMTQLGERSEEGEINIQSPLTLDSRVDFTRQVDLLRVAGNGVRLIYANDGTLLGLDLVWRSIDQAHQSEVVLAVNREQAFELFNETVERYTFSGGVIDLIQAELVYVDPDPREALTTLQPTYLFMYRVLNPIEEQKDEFVIGKKQFVLFPAVKGEFTER